MSWSEKVLNEVYKTGYIFAAHGTECKCFFTDEELQAKFEEGYSKRYEEEQQITHKTEEQEGCIK